MTANEKCVRGMGIELVCLDAVGAPRLRLEALLDAIGLVANPHGLADMLGRAAGEDGEIGMELPPQRAVCDRRHKWARLVLQRECGGEHVFYPDDVSAQIM